MAPDPAAATPARGLVYHAGALGDFVLSLPAVFRLTRAHPGLTWELWGPGERLALLPGFGPSPPKLLRSGHTLWGETPAPEVLDALRRFRVVLAFGGRAPPSWAVPAGPRVLRVASFPPAGGPWVPAHQARQLDAQGVPPVAEPWLAAWRELVLPSRRPAEIVLHPGSGDPAKNAPLELWIEVLAELRRSLALPLRLVLGPTEEERGGWEALTRHADRVSGCGTLGDLLGVLASAAVFLGNDSGASQLAAALGVPSLVLFGPSDSRLWRPIGPRASALQTPWPCAPCTAGQPIRCTERACWAGLAPARVAQRALERMGPHPPGGSREQGI